MAGKKVLISTGTSTFGAGATFDKATFVGQGSGREAWAATLLYCDYKITLNAPANLQDMAIYGDADTDPVICMEALPYVSYSGTPYYALFHNKLLDGLFVMNPNNDMTGSGIKLEAIAQEGETRLIEMAHFGAIGIEGYAIGWWAYAEEVSTGDAWINGINVDSLITQTCENHILLEDGGGSGEVQGHTYSMIQMQNAANQLYGIRLLGGAKTSFNKFRSVFAWDWTNGNSIHIAANTQYTYARGRMPLPVNLGDSTNKIIDDAGGAVEHHTADDTLTVVESESTHTNLGENGAMTLTLPAAPPIGTEFHFAVMYADELRVKVGAAGDSICASGAVNTDDGGGDGYMTANDEGECMTLIATSTTQWTVKQMYGTWGWVQP